MKKAASPSGNQGGIKDMEAYTFQVLGCRGSRPMDGSRFREFGGATSCYIIKADQHAVVLDCGTGLYSAEKYLEGCTQIDVLLTHLHYDHILGFLNWAVFPKGARVRLYAGVKEYEEGFSPADFLKPPFWPVTPDIGEVICVDSDSSIRLTERCSVRFYPSNHPDEANIIRVDTDNGSMCLASDWEHGKSFPEDMVKGCSFILYDGMFTEAEYPACAGWGHSTWQEGVKLARKNGISRLYITHHLPDRGDEELRMLEAEAKKAFPAIHFARAGENYSFDTEERVC